MTTPEFDPKRLLDEVRAVRKGLRYPFGPGLSEEDLIGAMIERSARGNPAISWKVLTEKIGPMLAEIAAEREAASAQKYRGILVGRAKSQWKWLDLPASRLDYEDLASLAWTQAIMSHDTFKGRTEADYVAWLNRIFDRLAINEQWYQKAEKRKPKREISAGPGEDSPVEHQHDSHQTTPSEPARNREFVAAICQILATFEPREIEALTLYCQGESMVAIGEALDIGKAKAATLIGKLQRRLSGARGAAEGIRSEKLNFNEIILEALERGGSRREQPGPDA